MPLYTDAFSYRRHMARALPLMLLVTLCLGVSLLHTGTVQAAPYQSLKLYLDADQTGTRNAGQAILKGMQLALAEVDNQLQGIPVSIVIRNHRGSSPRSLHHLKQFAAEDNGLAVFAGLHSPPLLAHKDFINQNGLLTMVPWAAAGPITRSNSRENWIFRLSVDDSKAGEVITRHAVDEQKFHKPYLLLEETGWGRSNQRTMTHALESRKLEPVGISWFNWGLGEAEARLILRDIMDSGADVIFMVANAPEGITFANAMLSLPAEKRLPIRSHWGITGGNFADQLQAHLATLDLTFIQTRFSFVSSQLNPFQRQVQQQMIAAFPDINSAADLKAPTGFIHAYDLTRLFIDAANRIELTGDIKQDRQALREMLETNQPAVSGLIKIYRQPFKRWQPGQPDAHEALRQEDYRMGYYDANGIIRLDL